MPGEILGEIGREYVSKLIRFFDRKFGFKAIENAYRADDAATIKIGDNVYRFDLFMIQDRDQGNPEIQTVNFICECKYQSNPAQLMSQFKDFYVKVMKTFTECKRRYNEDFHYVFITNRAARI